MVVKVTYFVHGTTIDNENGIATGWAPGELSDTGKEQAVELAKQTAHIRFNAVFCSDLKRAVDSATISFSGKNKIIQDKRLRECNYGDFNSKPEKFKKDMTRYIDRPFPNGECYKDVEKRIVGFVLFLKENYDNKHIAIVAHQAPQLALEVITKHKTWKEAITGEWRSVGKWQPGWEYSL
ncbi:MAG: histidine phosphatase family protein [Candidatus Marsarchaeota archaeon]|nr:histidine phosphatase family protein [Candidatus Marsarchaeota archaeon]